MCNFKATIIAFGLFLQTLAVLSQISISNSKGSGRKMLIIIPAIFTSFLVWICLNQATVFSLCCGTSSLLFYNWLYIHLLKVLPRSFTLGEVSIVSQGFVLFLLNAGLRFFEYSQYNAVHGIDDISLILQVGLSGVLLIVTMPHFFNLFQTDFWFYVLLSVVTVLVSIFPVNGTPAASVLLHFVLADRERVVAGSVAVFLLGVTVATVLWFLTTKQQSNTRTRKLFHILVVAVFLPGIIYQCQFLFITTVMLLAIFVVLETARVLELKFISNALDQTIEQFIDEKDAGKIALTPIYLLVGCSLPLWLHPCPWCPVTYNQIDVLPLLSGVLSVGVGDTVASVVGSKFGRNMWLNGVKSIEGTLASILAQGLLLISLVYFHYLRVTTYQICISVGAIILNSFVEANTNQVDNLVLPLITFIILSLS